jgi:hypothetical protein
MQPQPWPQTQVNIRMVPHLFHILCLLHPRRLPPTGIGIGTGIVHTRPRQVGIVIVIVIVR